MAGGTDDCYPTKLRNLPTRNVLHKKISQLCGGQLCLEHYAPCMQGEGHLCAPHFEDVRNVG